MFDVILAPAALLGKIDRERNNQPINTSPHLPLGDKVANTQDRFNDNYKTIEYKSPTIADVKTRNEQTNEQKFTLAQIDLVGKDSPFGPAHIFDQSAINKVNTRITDDTTLQEYRDEITSRFNLVATPFVTADPIYPGINDT